MTAYLIRRILGSIGTLLLLPLIILILLALTPGDVVEIMLGNLASQEMIDSFKRYYGLDDPLIIQYKNYLAQLIQGNLGVSFRTNRPIVEEIGGRWVATLQLTSSAMVLATVLGLLTGMFSAIWRQTWIDSFVRVISLLGLSMPVFWSGLMLMIVFGLWLGWLPTGGVGGVRHLILPAITLAFPSLGMIARMARSSILEVMGEDYVRTARAKGLAERVVLVKHALKNALIPIVTLLGLQTGLLLGGAVLTETVFSWPGIGRYIVESIFTRDIPALLNCILILAATFTIINLIVDISYTYLDPRIKYQ